MSAAVSEPIRIIFDTDLAMGVPGSDIDDGFALALALAEPRITIDAITTVNGNADVESGSHLSVELLDRLGAASLPVFQGAAAPFQFPDRRRGAPAEIRKKFGHRLPQPGYAAVELARRVAAEPGVITILAIGPLTNLATAINLDPNFAANVKEIVVMGGVYMGQTSESRMPGEFNFWNDPEAAEAVMRSGAPIRLVGLDVTEKVRLTKQHAQGMQASSSSFAQFAGTYTLGWIDFLESIGPDAPHAGESCALHDPLAVAALAHPELITWADAHVAVVTGTSIARGVVVTDLLARSGAPKPNARVAVAVDADAFLEYFFTSLEATGGSTSGEVIG